MPFPLIFNVSLPGVFSLFSRSYHAKAPFSDQKWREKMLDESPEGVSMLLLKGNPEIDELSLLRLIGLLVVVNY
jgi:hypothetical protein